MRGATDGAHLVPGLGPHHHGNTGVLAKRSPVAHRRHRPAHHLVVAGTHVLKSDSSRSRIIISNHSQQLSEIYKKVHRADSQ